MTWFQSILIFDVTPSHLGLWVELDSIGKRMKVLVKLLKEAANA